MALLLPSASTLRRTLALKSLKQFTFQAWPTVEPSTKLIWNWHLDVLCNELEQVLFRRLALRGADLATNAGLQVEDQPPTYYTPEKYVINEPPGCGKSMILSVMFNAWAWTHDPGLRFLTAAYSDDNTVRDNLRVRDIVTSDWYQSNFDLELREDQSGKIRFNTTAQGWRIASSVRGTGTGEHPDFFIIDDPVKAKDFRSDKVMDEVNTSFLDSTLPSRVARDPVIFLVMQRLSLKDPSQHLLNKGGWKHIYFPMRFIPTEYDESGKVVYEPCALDRRQEPGELLFPALWHEEKVKAEELELGPMGRPAQLQQRPTSLEGTLIKRAWLPIIEPSQLPKRRRACRGWDTADTEGAGNFTCGHKVSIDEHGIIYLEHFIRGQWKSPTVHQTILLTAKADGRDCLIAEGSGVGKSTTDARAIDLAGYDYKVIPEQKSKVVRTDDGPFRTQCEAGNVRVVRTTHFEIVIDVLTSFPLGEIDDDVDAIVNAVNRLVTERPMKRRARGIVNASLAGQSSSQ